MGLLFRVDFCQALKTAIKSRSLNLFYKRSLALKIVLNDLNSKKIIGLDPLQKCLFFQVSRLKVTATQMVASDSLRDLSIESRKCRFPDEIPRFST